MKRGISLAILAVTILILVTFVSAIVFNTDYIFVNTEISKLQIDISQIEALMKIYKLRNNGNVDFTNVLFDVSNLTKQELNQFIGEDITDSKIQLYVINLEAIDCENSNYGKQMLGEKDRYLYSLVTGKVYYEKGINEKGIVYYYVKDGEK